MVCADPGPVLGLGVQQELSENAELCHGHGEWGVCCN